MSLPRRTEMHSIQTLLEEEKCTVKIKLRNTCEKYGKIGTPFSQQKIIDNLMNNETIHIYEAGQRTRSVIRTLFILV